jgi:DNA invertase Pin-like site-specific DNA recombinase
MDIWHRTIGMKAKRVQAVVGYMRVSTARQGEEGISLDLQERAIRQFAQTRGLPVIGNFSDVGSGRGRSSIHRRRGLRNALEACRTYDAILVVWDWSHLSREVSTAEELVRLLPLPEKVHSIRDEESFEDARKHARFVHAQDERDAIAKRTKVAMDERKRAGKTFGNPDIRTVQVSGRDAWSQMSEDIARSIAVVLLTLPDWKTLKRRELAGELNKRGLLTGQGLPWNASRIREPLKRAKEMLAEDDDEAMRKHPAYGLF